MYLKYFCEIIIKIFYMTGNRTLALRIVSPVSDPMN